MRYLNIGARADFTSVSPVFPSAPPWTAPRSIASASMAGTRDPTLGVKLMYASPPSMAAKA